MQLFEESPFKINISFHKLIENWEVIAKNELDFKSKYAQELLDKVALVPEFKTGILDISLLEKNQELIKILLSDLFPAALTHNEIKAVTIPFQNITFNYTERFKNIIADAGATFDINFRDFDNNQFYIMSCCLILNQYYDQKFDFSAPLFYDIPDANGVLKHYRILYNADFVEIKPTQNACELNADDIEFLINNYDSIDAWKQKFPPSSWTLNGFGIVQLYDATIESALSILKSDLLKPDSEIENFTESSENIFRSIFKIPDLKVGFSLHNQEDNTFSSALLNNQNVKSFILLDSNQENYSDCKNEFYNCFYETIITKKNVFAISDVEKFGKISGNEQLANHLLSQNIHSIILAPIVKKRQLLGIVELVSEQKKVLNSLNSNKLKLVLPYLVDTIDRYNIDFKNQIDAVVQKEYTAIHNSVYWKFKKEAQTYLQSSLNAKEYNFKEIVFKEVYPLFGQIDVKGSSEHRNTTVKIDLSNQLEALLEIISSVNSNSYFLILEQREFELKSLLDEINENLKADTEQNIQKYIETEVHPVLKNTETTAENDILIAAYFNKIDEKTGMFYNERKKFDNTLYVINKKLAKVLDAKQLEAQQIFPHYYERFKTDGVEHNLYIGASIDPEKTYNQVYLSNLRLWQLQTLCEMELEHYKLKKELPYTLEVASLILVFSSPITIRFRMDEKRFDVDGSYNARYEVIKKRIDKAYIKNTEERITEKEKITIVYSNDDEQEEYLKYIKFLQSKDVLEPHVEHFDIEDLQGVFGLRGIRVKVVN